MKKEKLDQEKENTRNEYTWKTGEKELKEKRKKRFDAMVKKRDDLGIVERCNRYDALFTPHLVSLDNPSNVEIQTSSEFQDDKILQEKARKSMPLAFEKISTAISLLIQNNPRGTIKPAKGEYKINAPIVEQTYYTNFNDERKKYILQKYTYHLAKYGKAYWREYIKKTYKKEHFEKKDENGNVIKDDAGNVIYDAKWVYKKNAIVGENLHPRQVILDDNCYGVKDVNKPARDIIYIYYFTQEEFNSCWPKEYYPNAEFVKENQVHMINDKGYEKSDDEKEKPNKIQVLVYENEDEDIRETWANCLPLESIPLPAGEISCNGDKWVEDKDNYDGIGICNILEIYLPLVDDIRNSSLERLRQIVRPSEDWFNGCTLEDESDDVNYESGATRKFDGSPDEVRYNSPEPRTDSELKEEEGLMAEIDRATFVTRGLGGLDESGTAFQAAQNREASLQKMSIPLGSIKKTIEDAANLDIKLYKLFYSQPEETVILKKGDDNFQEAIDIYNQDKNDVRVQVMASEESTGITSIARRRFATMELPLTKVEKNGQAYIETVDVKDFWEAIPEHYDFKGKMEINAMSFLPISKALEDDTNSKLLDYLLKIQNVDANGQPTLTDSSGKPYIVNKVLALKEFIKINPNYDPEKFVVEMTPSNVNPATAPNPLETPSTPGTFTQKLGIGNPETGTKAI